MPVGDKWFKANAVEREQIVQANADKLFSGYKFNKSIITWSAPKLGSIYQPYVQQGESPKFTPFTDTYIQAAKSIFNYLSSFLNIDFQYSESGSTDLNFGFANLDNSIASGYAQYPGTSTGDIRLDDLYKDSISSFSQYLLTHEIGHGLGLKHTHESGVSKDLDTTYSSVMSYNLFYKEGNVTSFMPLDIKALKDIYGERQSTSSPFVYQFLSLDSQGSQSQYFSCSANKATLYLDSPSSLCSSSSNVELNFDNYINRGNGSGVIVDLVENYLTQARSRNEINTGASPSSISQQYDYTSESWATLNPTKDYPYSPYIPTVLLDSNLKVSRVVGSQNDDYFWGDEKSTYFSGGAGDDLIVPGTGNDTIDGGAGADTLRLNGFQKDYKITALNPASNPNSTFLITNQSTKEVDTVTGIEKLEFVRKNGDTIVGVDRVDLDAFGLVDGKDSNSGKIFRIYNAAFGRLPDASGLRYWINQSAQSNIQDIAQGFISSQEFSRLYGTNNPNSEFAKNLYTNILGRSPDSSGLNYWVSVLDSGASRSGVLVGFAESSENKQIFSQLTGFI